MNDRQLTIKIGVTSSYFASMRLMSPEKDKFIFGFDNDRYKSFDMYILYVESLITDMKDILARFKHSKKEYGKVLVDLGLSEANSLRHIYYHDEKIVKRINKPKSYLTINYRSIQRFRTIVEALKDKK